MNPYESQPPQGETPQDSDSFTPKTELLLPEAATPEQPSPLLETSATEDSLQPTEERGRKPWLKVGGAVAGLALLAAGAVGFGLNRANGQDNSHPPTGAETVATSTTTTSPNTDPSATPTTEVTAEATPPSKYETMNQTGVFSPEALSKLSATELTALFQIKQSEAPTGAVYAEVLGQRLEAWGNAGGTKAEWLPYKNTAKGTYETALAEKYNNPIAEGVLGHDSKPEAQEDILNRRNVMYILGKELVYTVDYVEGSVVVTPQPDGSENISAEYAYTDNFGEAKKVLGGGVETDAAHYTLRWNLNEVRANTDGVLYPSTGNTTVVTQ